MSKKINKNLSWEDLQELKVGETLVVVETNSHRYLPIGFKAVIIGKATHGDYITFQDTGGVGSQIDVDKRDIEESLYIFKKLGKVTHTKSTLAKRKAAAKAIRKLEKELLEAVDNASNEFNLNIDASVDIYITYQPPEESY